MFRAAASRIPRRVALATVAAGTGVVLAEQPREKFSIYSSQDPKVVLAESTSPLSLQIAVYRRHLQNTYADSHAYVQGWVSKWIGFEQAVESRVKSIISPNEQLTPGLLYVGVSTLTGSILARNRFILTRLVLPPIFLIASTNHFLPQTTSNLSAYLGSVEETYFPTLAEKHDIAKAHTLMTWELIKEFGANAQEKVREGTLKSVDKIQQTTGLKVRETLGLGLAKGEQVLKKAEDKTVGLVHAAEKVVKEAGEAKTIEPVAVEPPVAEKQVEQPPKRLV